MSKLTQSIILALIATAVMSRADWIEPHDEADFEKSLADKPIIAVFFYDSLSCSFCKRFVNNFFEDLLGDKVLLEQRLRFMRVDVAKSTLLKARYELEKKSHFMILTESGRIEMEDFHETQILLLERKISPKQLYDIVKGFLYEKLLSSSKVIDSMKEFQRLMYEKGALTVFVGEENANYKLYDRVAKINTGEQLYHVTKEALKKQINTTFDLKDLGGKDFVATFREDRGLSDFDTERVKTLVVSDNFLSVERFVEFERHPKLRAPEYSRRNVDDLLKYSHQMLLYVRSSPINFQNDREFKQAVKELPKRFIFAYVDFESNHNLAYRDLFLRAETEQEPESIYLVYKLRQNKILVEIYKGPFESKSIKDFVVDFFKQRGYLFGEDQNSYINGYLEPLDADSEKVNETGET